MRDRCLGPPPPVACRDRAGDFLRDTGGGVLRGTTGDSHTFIISAIGDGVAVSPARLCLVCSHPGQGPTVCFVQTSSVLSFVQTSSVSYECHGAACINSGEGSDPRKIHVVDRQDNAPRMKKNNNPERYNPLVPNHWVQLYYI
jgi:hypothetical protein